MSHDDHSTSLAGLSQEEIDLRKKLTQLEDALSPLRSNIRANHKELISLEKQIRRIVLRLTEIEREQIEIAIALGT